MKLNFNSNKDKNKWYAKSRYNDIIFFISKYKDKSNKNIYYAFLNPKVEYFLYKVIKIKPKKEINKKFRSLIEAKQFILKEYKKFIYVTLYDWGGLYYFDYLRNKNKFQKDLIKFQKRKRK